MSLYYLILWNQVDILQKLFKKDHVHMRLWMRFYGMFIFIKYTASFKLKVFATKPPFQKLMLSSQPTFLFAKSPADE